MDENVNDMTEGAAQDALAVEEKLLERMRMNREELDAMLELRRAMAQIDPGDRTLTVEDFIAIEKERGGRAVQDALAAVEAAQLRHDPPAKRPQ